jgi:hypothetical protein
MEDFVVTCQLVPCTSHLISGSCSSPRAFGLDFLQTSPHDDALALLLAFGSVYTWREVSHLASSVPCPAHTARVSGARQRVRWSRLLGPFGKHLSPRKVLVDRTCSPIRTPGRVRRFGGSLLFCPCTIGVCRSDMTVEGYPSLGRNRLAISSCFGFVLVRSIGDSGRIGRRCHPRRPVASVRASSVSSMPHIVCCCLTFGDPRLGRADDRMPIEVAHCHPHRDGR